MGSSAGAGTFCQGINSVQTADFPQGFHLFFPLFIRIPVLFLICILLIKKFLLYPTNLSGIDFPFLNILSAPAYAAFLSALHSPLAIVSLSIFSALKKNFPPVRLDFIVIPQN